MHGQTRNLIQAGMALLVLLATPLWAEDTGSGIVSLTLIPTRVERSEELRINTGKKAVLADGSYNTVYDFKRPKADHVFLEIEMDVSVENGPMVFDAASLRLHGDVNGDRREYHPIDWYRDDGLVEARGDTLNIPGLASIRATFEVPRSEVERLTFSVGGLRVGSVPGIVSRIGRQE